MRCHRAGGSQGPHTHNPALDSPQQEHQLLAGFFLAVPVSIPWHVNLFLHPFSVLSLQTPVYTSPSLSMLSEAPSPQSVSPTHVTKRDGLWLSSSSCAIWVPEQPDSPHQGKRCNRRGREAVLMLGLPACGPPQRAVCVSSPRHLQKISFLSFFPCLSPESSNPSRFWPGEEPQTTYVPGTRREGQGTGLKPNPGFKFWLWLFMRTTSLPQPCLDTLICSMGVIVYISKATAEKKTNRHLGKVAGVMFDKHIWMPLTSLLRYSL